MCQIAASDDKLTEPDPSRVPLSLPPSIEKKGFEMPMVLAYLGSLPVAEEAGLDIDEATCGGPTGPTAEAMGNAAAAASKRSLDGGIVVGSIVQFSRMSLLPQ